MAATEPPNRQATDPFPLEDWVGGDDSAGDAYFTGSEFQVRADLEADQFWHRHRRDVIREGFIAYGAEHKGPLLEVGCGIGTVATHLNRYGLEVDYGDIFVSALKLAHQRARDALGDAADRRRFHRVDMTQPLPFHDYQGILLLDVIEHLPDDLTVMRHVHDALQGPHAFTLVTVPAYEFLWSPWDDKEKHKRRYTKASLRQVLEEAGFVVERMTHFFGPLFFAALGVKTLRRAREWISPAPEAGEITELAEGKNHPALNALMLGVLSPERRVLKRARRSSLPFGGMPVGTSLLAIARRG